MEARGWQYSDLVRESGESRSVVSQWLGRGSKEIKSIGKQEAAERLERASGYAALWIAKGIGPKYLESRSASMMVSEGGAQDMPVVANVARADVVSRSNYWPFAVSADEFRRLLDETDIRSVDAYIHGLVAARRNDARKSGTAPRAAVGHDL